jgi:hypothetical protein
MNKFLTATITLVYLGLVSFTVFETKIGERNAYEEAYSAIAFEDGYLVSGSYNTSGGAANWKSYLVFINHDGDTVWSKKDMQVNGFARKTNDGNIIFIGGNTAGLMYDSIKISKADILGNTLWSQSFSLSNCRSTVTDIAETNDGFVISGYYVSGACNNPSHDAFVMKLDATGNEVWREIYSGQFDEQFHSIKTLPNGNIAAFGWSSTATSNNLADYLLAIYSNKGILINERMYGDDQRNYGYGLEVLNDGSMILNGYGEKMEIMQVAPNLEPLWTKTFENSCGTTYFKVKKTNDGGLAITGTESINNECVSVFYKIKTNGDIVWKKSFGGLIREFTETTDGKFVMAGFADYLPNMYIVKFDSVHIQQSNTVVNRFEDKPLELHEDIDVSAFLEDMGITTKVDEVALEQRFPSVKLFPNPATENLSIEFFNPDEKSFQLEVYDFGGSLVMQQKNITQSSIQIQKGWLSSGVYTYKLVGAGNTHCGKFIFK